MAIADPPSYVSTGSLPSHEQVEALVAEAYERFRPNDDGRTSGAYPVLAAVPRDLFGLTFTGVHGQSVSAGDAATVFTIMSVSKPFVFALLCQHFGADRMRNEIGVNAIGLPFNSIEAVEQRRDGRTNPMVNSGAIATSSLAPGSTVEERWQFLQTGLSKLAGRDLTVDPVLHDAAIETNHRNRAIAHLLESRNLIAGEPMDAVELYTRQCCLTVTAADLAVMAATLADGGVNPVTGQRVVDPEICRYTLAVMTTAGFYEASGDWLFDVGAPGKSGISGGIIVVSPGKGGLGVFAPPLDASGNSVKGTLVARFLSRALGLDIFASQPV